ncbi:MAG: dATP/dGTP diphosphohydrolase domain-containing protein [Bacteroidota bacterium]
MEIKDSGTRREFGTGAVRDMAEGKGDFFSLPPSALLRVAKHYEGGAKKYGRNNYQKGIPISAFMDSALRHIFKYLDGQSDEDHLSAAAFNILGAIQMEERNPKMQDVETRLKCIK